MAALMAVVATTARECSWTVSRLPADVRRPPEPSALEGALRAAAAVANMRAAYFAHLARHSSAHWTAAPYMDTGLRLVNACGQAICGCGDSLVREVSARLAAIQGKADGFRWPIGDQRCYTFEVMDRDLARANWTGCDTIVVTVPGLHTLFRKRNQWKPHIDNKNQSNVFNHGRQFVRHVSKAFALANRTGVHVMLVGTPTLNGLQMASVPPKRDFKNFLPVALAEWYGRREAAAAARLVGGTGLVSYVDLGRWTRTYMGVRCDGMHLGSDFRYTNDTGGVVACHRSDAIYDLAILDALGRAGALRS